MLRELAMVAERDAASAPVRIGVLVESSRVDFRTAEVLRLLQSSGAVELVWVGVEAAACAPDAGPRGLPRWTLRVDAMLRESLASPDTLGSAEVRDLVDSAEVLDARTWREALGLLPPAGEGEGARSVDLVLVTDTAVSPVELARDAGLPVWWFHADGGQTGTPLEGFRAVAQRQPVASVRLCAVQPSGGVPKVLGTAETRTHVSSPGITRSRLIDAGVRLFADALLTLQQVGLARAMQRNGACADAYVGRAQDAGVSAPQALRVLRRALTTAVRSRLRGESGEVQWSIALGTAEDCDWRGGRFEHLEWMQPERDRFLSDPCLFEHDGRTWLFMEELRFAEGRGVISVMDASDPHAWRSAERVLEQPFHLSFPRVVAADGEVFMVPEQLDAGALVLYRAHAFPGDWRPHATLLENTHAADPVLLQHGDHWWLFFSRGDYSSYDNNLQLYFARHIDGPYHRHPHSPVCEGLVGSRMAGPVFSDGGQLIRPAQDCRRHYGAALVFNRILELTPESYREAPVSRVDPDAAGPFGQGMHSYCRSGELVAVDGFRYRSRGHRG